MCVSAQNVPNKIRYSFPDRLVSALGMLSSGPYPERILMQVEQQIRNETDRRLRRRFLVLPDRERRLSPVGRRSEMANKSDRGNRITSDMCDSSLIGTEEMTARIMPLDETHRELVAVIDRLNINTSDSSLSKSFMNDFRYCQDVFSKSVGLEEKFMEKLGFSDAVMFDHMADHVRLLWMFNRVNFESEHEHAKAREVHKLMRAEIFHHVTTHDLIILDSLTVLRGKNN